MSVLAVRTLSKAFGGVRAVNEVSFAVGQAEFLAMIGPNGAGKSTCFNMINGQLAPDSGEILIEGKNIAGLTPREVWRLGVGRTFQVAATFGSMTVAENVQMALISHGHDTYRLWHPAAGLHRERALTLLEQVGMRDAADRPSRELAYGDVKRVELAIALANDPRLLLMESRPPAWRGRAAWTDRIGQAAGDGTRHLGAVHRAFDGRGVRLRRPHHRAGARPADRRRRCRYHSRQCASARGLFRHRQDLCSCQLQDRMSGEPMLAVEGHAGMAPRASCTI
jgi:ABC-type lipopolysaccharide export system ATPase subunit